MTPDSLARLALSCVLALAFVSIGCRTTLEAKATGSRAPKTRDCSQGQRIDIQNGDFTIVQSCLSRENLVVGDGISEETHWVFDLHDEDIGSCYPETASIEMRLRPTGHLMTEELRVEGSFAMGLEAIQSMNVGEEQKLVVDMMLRNGRPSPYTPSEIRRLLLEEHGGRLPMVYELNALVSEAKLEIRCRR
jgi:hypothetical protein